MEVKQGVIVADVQKDAERGQRHPHEAELRRLMSHYLRTWFADWTNMMVKAGFPVPRRVQDDCDDHIEGWIEDMINPLPEDAAMTTIPPLSQKRASDSQIDDKGSRRVSARKNKPREASPSESPPPQRVLPVSQSKRARQPSEELPMMTQTPLTQTGHERSDRRSIPGSTPSTNLPSAASTRIKSSEGHTHHQPSTPATSTQASDSQATRIQQGVKRLTETFNKLNAECKPEDVDKFLTLSLFDIDNRSKDFLEKMEALQASLDRIGF